MVANTHNTAADAWQQMADAALNLGRRGDMRGALSILQNGLHAARHAGELRGEVVALNGVALLHSIRGDFWASLATSIDAFFLAKKHNDRRGMAHAMTMLAGALLLMTPVDSEICLLQTALEIAVDERDLRLQVRIHNLLGILLGDLGRFEQAETHLDLGLVLAECDQNGFDRWRVLANSANLQRKRAEAAESAAVRDECISNGLALIARVEAHCAASANVPILLDALRIAAMMEAVRGRGDLSQIKFSAAWKLANDKKQRSVLPALGVEMARMELDGGRLNAAEVTLTDALREAGQYRPSPKAPHLCTLMARLHAMRADPRGEAHWRAEAEKAHADFEGLRQEARKQLLRVAQSLDLSPAARR